MATLTRRVSIIHYPVGGSNQCSPSISGGRIIRRRMSNGGFGFSIESKQISTRRSGVPGIFHPRKRSGTFCSGKITPPGPSRGPSRARGPHARLRINILISLNPFLAVRPFSCIFMKSVIFFFISSLRCIKLLFDSNSDSPIAEQLTVTQ